jgi:peptidoglycan/LPS O-acetylase OafA/YrhL
LCNTYATIYERDSPRKQGQRHFFHLPLMGRVVSLDVLRGLAIFCMTSFHQSIVIQPDGNWALFAGFLGFISAPLFLAISGIAVTFHEHSYHWPFKMMVHGGLLFALAYGLDVFVHHSWRVDWDIFQNIGACYAGLGLLDYLGYGWRKVSVLAVVLLGLYLYPAVRPDHGVFPVWPFGLYFIGGYLLALLGQRPWMICRWLIWGLAIAGLGYFLAVFSWDPPPDRTKLAGFIFLFAIIYILLLAALKTEKRGLLEMRGFSVLIRWGKYALTLYFIQQFFTVTRLHLPLPLPPTWVWMVQTAVLLALLHTAVLFMERYAFLNMSWWLRQAEQRVMKWTPTRGILGPR